MRDGAATEIRRARRVDPMLLGGLVLVALQTGVRAFLVLGSSLWQDDLFHLSMFQRWGLSREFLVREHNGHLEIGPNLVYAVLGREPGLSFVPAALTLLALQLVASCLLLAVLRLLFGRSPWLLVPFTVYLFTPLALPAATWLAAGLEALPLQIALLTALLGGVRAYRDRSWWWVAVSVSGTATGLLFWEKAVLVLPALVAVLVLVEEAGTPWRASLRRVAGSWPYLLPHALLVGAYVPFYLSVVGRSELAPQPGAVLPTTAETVFSMLLPGLFGGPWTAQGADDTVAPDAGTVRAVLAVVLAAVVVVVSIRLRGARAAKAWLLVAGYLTVDIALVQLTRAADLAIAARDPRYITDAIPVIVLGCCAAFSGPRRSLAAAVGTGRASGRAAPALAVSALLVASSLFTSSLLVDELQHTRARNFVADVLQTMDARPEMSVVSTLPPVHVTIFESFDLDETLRAVGEPRRFDRPGTEMGMFDQHAVLRPITLLEPIMKASGPVPGCGWRLPAGGQLLGDVPIWFGLQVLRFGYDSPAEVTLHLAVGDDRQDVTVPAGRGRVMFVVTGQQGPVTVRASGVPADAVCVDDVVVGTPWPEGLG